jgi:hypothetical protein
MNVEMTLLQRARAHLALSPLERALLRLLKALAVTALLATLPVLSDLCNALATNQLNVDWRAWGLRLLVAAGTALVFALQKYYAAQGDGPPITPAAPPGAPAPTLWAMPTSRAGSDAAPPPSLPVQ